MLGGLGVSRSGPLGGLVWSAERLRRCHGPVRWEAASKGTAGHSSIGGRFAGTSRAQGKRHSVSERDARNWLSYGSRGHCHKVVFR